MIRKSESLQIEIKSGYTAALIVDFKLELTWSRSNDFGIEENLLTKYSSLDETVALFKQVLHLLILFNSRLTLF